MSVCRKIVSSLFLISSLSADDFQSPDFETACKSIYNKEFQYNVPESFIKNWYHGTGFNRKEDYSSYEQKLVNKDFANCYHNMFDRNLVQEKLIVVTAGAPGAGKSLLQEKLLKEDLLSTGGGFEIAYIDPDRVCLQMEMQKTYLASIQKIKEFCLESAQDSQLRKQAYDDWRPASNAFCHALLGNLIKDGNKIYYGTTSTSPLVSLFFELLKNQDYSIHVIHVTAPDDVRWESIRKRDKECIQTTEEDVVTKGKLLPQRMPDYLKYADKISFYYRDHVDSEAQKAATWTRGAENSFAISNQEAYESIKEIHNSICRELNDDSITWEETVEKFL